MSSTSKENPLHPKRSPSTDMRPSWSAGPSPVHRRSGSLLGPRWEAPAALSVPSTPPPPAGHPLTTNRPRGARLAAPLLGYGCRAPPRRGLEDVGGREQPLAVAPLVDYESHLHTGALERLQRSGSRDTLRDKDWLPQRLQQVNILVGHHPRPGIFNRCEAQQVVEVPSGDRIVRVPLLDYQAPVLLRRIVGIQPDNLRSGRHELPHRAVVEAQSAAHEFPFLLLEDTRTLPLQEEGFDLLFGDGRIAGAVRLE